MMKMNYIWLIIHCAIWPLAFFEFTERLDEGQIASICLFFIILFILPLFKEKSLVQAVLFCIQALSTIVIFYPVDHVLNPYVLLIHALMIAESMLFLPRLKSLVVVIIQVGSAAWIVSGANPHLSQIIWYGIFYLLVVLAMVHYQSLHQREIEERQKNNALLDEYRRMKRQLVTEEEQTRQDERMLIGHEIHDSVGHKLTALLMQFEVFRIHAAENDKEKIENLKKLAEQSLEETRRAVKSFKSREVGGLHGLIRLIRRLEKESFMKINFTVKYGAFAAPLTGEQSFAIYRAVQEALTNIMKHSSTREAQVMFESPGGSIFRFEVMNIAPHNPYFQEGYGLSSMKERLEKVGGTLEIIHDERQFIVRGMIRLTLKESVT